MTMTDPISDLLTRIRNGQQVKKASITCPSSKFKLAILKVMKDEGYIRDYNITEDIKGKVIEISLKYFHGEPVIKELKRVSTPGRRVYLGVDNLPKVRQGLGVAIVSTSKGIMSDAKARQSRVGGEVLCTVF